MCADLCRDILPSMSSRNNGNLCMAWKQLIVMNFNAFLEDVFSPLTVNRYLLIMNGLLDEWLAS